MKTKYTCLEIQSDQKGHIYSFADLETVGLQLGAMEMEKKILVSKSDFDGAKVKREEMDTLRDEAYR